MTSARAFPAFCSRDIQESTPGWRRLETKMNRFSVGNPYRDDHLEFPRRGGGISGDSKENIAAAGA
jgi:hypothetical protein